MSHIDQAFLQDYFSKHYEEILRTYTRFLSFPTISSDPSFSGQMSECAHWLQHFLQGIGATVELWEEKGAPIVFASMRARNPDSPTILIYHHYDVQPTDPIEEWETSPFEAVEHEGVVRARGASDNKGPCLTTLYVLAALADRLPCHIKLLLDGEEESGSVSLERMISKKQEQLQSDYTMVIDLGMDQENVPAVTLGCRGMVTMTMTVRGPKRDLHSGAAGGLIYNPLQALVEMLASLRNADGSIAVPGFYDGLVPMTEEEHRAVDFSFDEERWKEEVGQSATGGEQAFSPLERNWIRPTLEINGIHGGYGGCKVKTVIPREAVAKLSCRLVPGQQPQEIGEKIARFLLDHKPEGVDLELTIHDGSGEAFRVPVHHGVRCLERAMQLVWKTSAVRVLNGASIPIIALLQKATEGKLIPWGLSLLGDHIHSPNEQYDMQRIERGFVTLALAIAFLGQSE